MTQAVTRGSKPRSAASLPRIAFCACALSSAFLAAQTSVQVPESAGREGSTATPTLFSQDAGRIQQVFVGDRVMNTFADIRALRFRLDGTRAVASAARTLRGFKMWLGYSSVTPATMATGFAGNRTGAQTLVFDGDLALPAQTANVRAFNIRVAFNKVASFNYDKRQGNLLVECAVSGTARSDFGYMIDAHVESTTRGYYTDFGVGGKLSNGETARVLVQDDWNLRPGRSFTMSVSALRAGYPTVALFGASNERLGGTLPLPLPLDGAGMTGNRLEVSPDFTFPVSLIQSGNTWVGNLRLAVPANALGFRLYAQFLFLDPPANAFGAALSPGLACWITSSSQATQYVTSRDAAAASGSIGNRGEGLVTQFEGVFR